VVPRFCLGLSEKKKIPCYCQKSKTNPWVYSSQARYLIAELAEESITNRREVENGRCFGFYQN